jgi:hypothetical protein
VDHCRIEELESREHAQLPPSMKEIPESPEEAMIVTPRRESFIASFEKDVIVKTLLN